MKNKWFFLVFSIFILVISIILIILVIMGTIQKVEGTFVPLITFLTFIVILYFAINNKKEKIILDTEEKRFLKKIKKFKRISIKSLENNQNELLAAHRLIEKGLIKITIKKDNTGKIIDYFEYIEIENK